MFVRKLLLLFVIFFLFFNNIARAGDSNADILKKLELNINKIEDIQCTLNVVQTGSYNPEVFKNSIDLFKTLEKLGFISSEEAREKIASKTEELENNKDFTFVHPTAKWKMKKSEDLYTALMDNGIQNYDGIRKIIYSSELKRGVINSELKLQPFNPYFVLSINNMSIVDFYKLALENNHLTVSRKDNLIEIAGMVPDENPPPGFPPNYLKLLIDPDKGYLPVYYEAGLKSGDQYIIKYTINDIQLEELDDNIWFPVSINTKNYDFVNVPDINIPPDEWKLISFPSHFNVNMALSEIKINQGLSKDDFKFEFPKGAHVSDRGLKRAYIAGLSGDPALDPKPLLGKPLPEFESVSLSAEEMQNKPILVCFLDMEQRPSRNCILQLSKRAQELKAKDVTIIAVHASKVEQAKLDEWAKENDITFTVGIIEGDSEKIQFTWGVKSLPWLILTDMQHIVQAEGFSLDELDGKIAALREK